jgi:ABC-2 type transport system ATP-binding protein
MLMAALYRVRTPDAKRRAGALLQEVGLYEKKAHLVKTFSLGMRKRLLLCLALVSEPVVLFLDEPTNGLDVQSARLIRGRLRDLKTAGTTIFLTTHNMEEANELCDRVAIIDHGKIVAIDTPVQLRIGSGRYHVVEIRFDKPVAPGALSQLCGVDGIEEGEQTVRIYTEDACGFVGTLVDFSRAHALRLVALNIRAPSLEDAFVRLTEEGGHAR